LDASNLDRRVEALFPVLHERSRERIRSEVLEPLDLDNSRVYEMDQGGQYQRREPAPEARVIDGQQLAQKRVNDFGQRRSNGTESRASLSEAQPASLQV